MVARRGANPAPRRQTLELALGVQSGQRIPDLQQISSRCGRLSPLGLLEQQAAASAVAKPPDVDRVGTADGPYGARDT